MERTATPGPFGRRLLARFFFWAFSGDAASKAAVLVASLVAVRSLEPVDFGLYIGLSATAILSASLWDLGVSSLLTRELAAARVTPRQAALQTARLRLKTAGMWLLSFAIGSTILLRGGGVSVITILAFAGASIVFGTHMIPLAMLRARLHFRASAIALASGRWCTALLSLLALPGIAFANPLDILSLSLFAGEVTTLGVALIAIVAAARRSSFTPSGRPPSETLKLRAALPFAANGIINLAYNRFDVVVLGALASAQQLGFYAPASRMQDALAIISATIATVAFPLIAGAATGIDGMKEVRSLVRRFTVVGIALSFPTALVFFIYMEQVVHFVMGDEYAGTVAPAQVLVWSLPLSAVTTVFNAALAGTGRALDTTKVFFTAFVVAALLHLSLDWWWGAMGAAVASLAREPAALVTSFVYARRAGILGRAESAPTPASQEQTGLESAPTRAAMSRPPLPAEQARDDLDFPK
jgi:O-antigen/teichoic acid export membrane protein